MFLLSPRNIFVSLNTKVVARYKVAEVAKLGDIEGTCHLRRYLARHISYFSQAFISRYGNNKNRGKEQKQEVDQKR